MKLGTLETVIKQSWTAAYLKDTYGLSNVSIVVDEDKSRNSLKAYFTSRLKSGRLAVSTVEIPYERIATQDTHLILSIIDNEIAQAMKLLTSLVAEELLKEIK